MLELLYFWRGNRNINFYTLNRTMFGNMKFIARVDQNNISHSFALLTGEISWSKFISSFAAIFFFLKKPPKVDNFLIEKHCNGVILVIYIRSKTIRQQRVIYISLFTDFTVYWLYGQYEKLS